MVYLVSRKFIDNNIMTMLIPNDYYLIDTENSTTADDTHRVLSAKYNKSKYVSGFGPDTTLSELIRRADRYLNHQVETPVDNRQYSVEVSRHFESRAFISSVVQIYRIFELMYTQQYRNIFIVLPNMQYRYLAQAYADEISMLMAGSFFIGDQSMFRNGRMLEVLEREFTDTDVDAILKRCDYLTRYHNLNVFRDSY